MPSPLDPALQALLADPRVVLKRPPPGVTVSQMRVAANAFMARAPRPPIHSATDISADTAVGPLRLRLYRPSPAPGLPLVLFIHGGGFIFGDLESHDAMARTLANGANAMVAAVDYRLAPEHPFPAALDDCTAALDWLAGSADLVGVDRSRLAVAGDSAGGQIALATALHWREHGRTLRHLGLFYPLLDPYRRSDSSRALAEDYMLTGAFIDWAWQAYASPCSHANPLFNVDHAMLEGLPPTTVITAEYDPLRQEGEAFADRLRVAHVPVLSKCYAGMIHGFAGLPHITTVAGEALAAMALRLKQALMA